jgi:site-specific recombinase XerD
VARRRLAELEEAYRAGDFDPWAGGWLREHVTAVAAVERFLDAKEADGLRASTVKTYRQQLGAFLGTLPQGGALDLDDVRAADLRAYVHDPSVSSATRRKRFRHVRAFLNWSVKTGLLDASPLGDLTPPKKETKEAAFLKPEDVDRLCIAIEHHVETHRDKPYETPDLDWLRDIILVAVATGLRRGELLNLRWADVDLDAGSLLVRHRDSFKTKGGAERRVPLAGDALATLRRMWRGRLARAERDDPGLDGPVFIDRRGLPVKPTRVSHRFKDMARLAGLGERVHFHTLRHTCASWLAMKGVPMRVIQAILGHSTVSVTERYSHLAPDALDAAMHETFGGA